MQLKKLLPKLFLVAGFIAVFFLIKYRDPLTRLARFNINKADVYATNFIREAGAAPKRLMPLVTQDKEAELKLGFGSPFVDFSLDDWKEFWNIVYGVFPLDPPDGSGLPQRVRQMTPEEIAKELAGRYPESFSGYNKDSWGSFFETLFR